MRIALEGAVASVGPEQLRRLRFSRASDQTDVGEEVRGILGRVAGEGDRALMELAREFDGAVLVELEVQRPHWEEARARLAPDALRALERSAANLRRFHSALLPADVRVETEPGVVLERRTVPVQRAGVYAPGGRATYPSSVLMGVVPARAAGVTEVVVCSPPGPDGQVSDGVLAAALVGGATRLFAVGGAGAVGALAYGTESVPAVDVLVGPGNRWVNEAKRQVAGQVRIDSPAGPSELLILADGQSDPQAAARELLAQAEHDPDAAVALVCTSESVLEATRAALQAGLQDHPRRGIVEASLAGQGALLLAQDVPEALSFAEAYAAEHLLLLLGDGASVLPRLRSAGTIFLGATSSVSFGDYLSGANHVLPTGGQARSFSGLSTDHFLRSFTVQRISAEGAARLCADTAILARLEGLPGHAQAALAAGGSR